MELLLTVSLVVGVFVLVFTWIAAVVLIKNDAFSDSSATRRSAASAGRSSQEQAPRELADASVN